MFIEMNTYFVKLQQIIAFPQHEDTSVYRDESTFRKIDRNTSLGQK